MCLTRADLAAVAPPVSERTGTKSPWSHEVALGIKKVLGTNSDFMRRMVPSLAPRTDRIGRAHVVRKKYH